MNKLLRFWQELKRRKVVRAITVYAASAFIILELVDIVAPSIGLPGWTLNLVIVLLCIGFLLTAILSWIFDITPEGVKKSDPVKEEEEKSTPPEIVRRKIKAGDAIIAVLIVIVCILLYPKIFKKDKFEGIRDPDGKISIAVMPFENLSGDTLLNVWQGGFQNILISTLSNSKELSIRQYQAMYDANKSTQNTNTASVKQLTSSELALKLQTSTFVIGKLLKAGDKIRINARLVNTETEEIFKTYQVDSNTEDDFFIIADSLAGLIRNYLEIDKLREQHEYPDFRATFLTNSAEAFQYYIHAYNAFLESEYQSSRVWFAKAIETDSSFMSAYVILALMTSDIDEAKRLCKLAYKHRDGLPLKGILLADYINAVFFETPNEQIKYLKQILEIEELNTLYWYLLGWAYYKIEQYEDAVLNFENALDIHKRWGTNYMNPGIYRALGDSYHNIDEHKKEIETYALGLLLFPDHPTIITYQTICILSQGDTVKAEALLNNYRTIRRDENRWSESRILSALGNIYEDAGELDIAESSYRKSLELDPDNPARLNDLARFLINNDINVNEGLSLAEKALGQRSNEWNYLDTKGWGLYKVGKYEEALKVLTDAWALKPTYDHGVYKHLEEAKNNLSSQ